MTTRTILMIAAVLSAGAGCGASTQTLIQCQADAVRALPEDVQKVTPYDIDDLYHRLKACFRKERQDAGAQ